MAVALAGPNLYAQVGNAASPMPMGAPAPASALPGTAQTGTAPTETAQTETAPNISAGAATGLASLEPRSRLRFNGYGSVGLSWLDQPTGWGYRRDISESGSPGKDFSAKIDSRLGLQLNYAINDQLEVVTQAVLRARADHAVMSAFEWAFIAWRPTPAWTLRAGRLNPDVFLLSDYRNVGFAYPWARPEVGFYGAIPLYSVAGADVARSWTDGDALWQVKGFIGSGKLGITPYQGTRDTRVRLDPSMGLTLSRELGGLTLKASVVRLRVSLENVPQLEQLDSALSSIEMLPVPAIQADVAAYRRSLGLRSGALNFIQIGARYEGDDWLWSAELANISGDYPTGHMVSGYTSLGRRFGAFTVYGVIAASRSRDREMPPPQWGATLAPMIGPERAAQIEMIGNGAATAINANRQQQRSLSLGVRWDVSPRMAIKAQWDRYLVDANGARAFFSNAAGPAGSMNVASVVLDFVF